MGAVYGVDRVDIALEMEQWAKWAALVGAALSACFSISCATSSLSTLYAAGRVLHVFPRLAALTA